MIELIVRKIKEARLEREFTQKDLANHLGKTAAAISDLERGKVQVTASDLYRISRLLNKPIEYFYGEAIGDNEIQSLISILRNEPVESRKGTIEFINQLLVMQKIGNESNSLEEDEELPVEKVIEFYKFLAPFSVGVNEMARQLNELREKFDEELKIRGINIPD